MALTPSTMAPLGTRAPSFGLPDTNGKLVTLDTFGPAPAYLVVFMCNHCPYVVHIRSELARLTSEYLKRGAAIFGINSNDASKYPADAPDKMREEKKKAGYEFPYLYDESQDTARAYDAACTPDFFLYGADQRLVYRGQFDGSRPGNSVALTGKDLRAALDSVLTGQPIPTDQKASVGCNIKWKS